MVEEQEEERGRGQEQSSNIQSMHAISDLVQVTAHFYTAETLLP